MAEEGTISLNNSFSCHRWVCHMFLCGPGQWIKGDVGFTVQTPDLKIEEKVWAPAGLPLSPSRMVISCAFSKPFLSISLAAIFHIPAESLAMRSCLYGVCELLQGLQSRWAQGCLGHRVWFQLCRAPRDRTRSRSCYRFGFGGILARCWDLWQYKMSVFSDNFLMP